MSKITFLGTAGDHPVVNKQLRGSGGFIFKYGRYQFHFDPGPGSLMRASQCEIDLSKTNVLIVTNSSLIHSNDLNAAVNIMTSNFQEKKGTLISNEDIIEGTKSSSPILNSLYRDFIENLIITKPDNTVEIDDMELYILKTKNEDNSIFGVKIVSPNFILSYSSDTEFSREVVRQYEGSDILILNVPNPFDVKSKNSLSSDDVIRIIDIVRPKLVILTHFGYKMLKVNPLYEAREIQRQTHTTVLSAYEGLIINLKSFSSSVKQVKLGTF